MAVVSRALDSVRSYIGSFTWSPLVALSRNAVLGLLSRVSDGQLIVVDHDGTVTLCGEYGATPKTELRVVNEAFWVRVALFADMGVAESFMLGEFTCPDLVAFFQIFILNRNRLMNATTLISSVSSTVHGLARKTNSLANSKLNISAHYDISNNMFASFLSPDMTYSCPIWMSRNDSNSSEETLEEAQQRKLKYIIHAAKIKASDHVLEIGTGWGSFAIEAVRATGCRITSLTLSQEQKDLADKLIAAAGYSDKVEVVLCDYRALPVPQDRYDKLVSIEMLEAVGREYLATYFECVDRLLKPDGGVAVFQCITMPEARYEEYSKGEDFIRKYIFPGGHLPTVSQLVGSIENGAKGSLVIDEIRNIGGHYAKTLRIWRQSFEATFQSKIRPSLLEQHPEMSEKDVELFRRKWEYYFTYCEAGFNTKTLGDIILTVGREGAMEMLEDVPL